MRTHPQITSVAAALLALMLVLAVLHAAPPLPRATPGAAGMSGERLQMATAILRQFVADRKISGAVAAVARRGKLVYLEPVGLQSFASKVPMTERSLFRIYSMTKAVTAVAVMMLVEERKIRLIDRASKYLPEFGTVMVQDAPGSLRQPSRAITIRDLLLHTSGLSHRTSELYRRLQVRSRSITLPQFVVNITRAPLLEDPGTRFRYSEATTVLGRVVEVASGQDFETFVTSRILQPLGMNDTAFWADPAARPRLTTVYRRAPDGTIAPFEIEEVPFTEKPALIEGTVGDGSRGYLTAIGECGWDGSAGTFFAVDPAKELVVTHMTQNLPANPDQLRQKFKAAVLQSIIE